MLDALRKKLFATNKEVKMEKEDAIQSELSAETFAEMAAELATSKEQLASAKEMLATLEGVQAQMAELSAALESTQAELTVAKQEKAEMIAQAAAAKLSARKEKVVEMIGTERADALMTATAEMNDEAFDAVLIAMAVATEKEADGAMFKEIGVAAESTKQDVDPVEKLAANLAAKFKQE